MGIFLSEALEFHQLGCNVLPIVGKDKKPLQAQWQQWQKQRQSLEDIATMFYRSDIDGLGIVIGGESNIRCLEIYQCCNLDIVYTVLEAMGLPPTYPWVVRYGSEDDYKKDYRIFFKCVDLEDGTNPLNCSKERVIKGYARKALSDEFSHIKLLWDRCFTILPLSKHPNGEQCHVLNTLDTENTLPDEEFPMVTDEGVFLGFDAIARLNKINAKSLIKSFLELNPEDDEELDEIFEFMIEFLPSFIELGGLELLEAAFDERYTYTTNIADIFPDMINRVYKN